MKLTEDTGSGEAAFSAGERDNFKTRDDSLAQRRNVRYYPDQFPALLKPAESLQGRLQSVLVQGAESLVEKKRVYPLVCPRPVDPASLKGVNNRLFVVSYYPFLFSGKLPKLYSFSKRLLDIFQRWLIF